MNKAILLVTLAIVAVAGCTQPGQFQLPFIFTSPTSFSGGNGLTITEFTVDNTELYANRSAKITMTVSNKGGAKVALNEAVVVLQGSAIKSDFTGGELYWTDRSSTTSVFQTLGKDMNPYDPVKDVPADEKTVNWYLTSPAGISAGTTRNDVFMGRIYYDYSTTVTGNIWVYTDAESEAAKASNRPLNQNSFTSTSGPISLVVTAKPTNVVVSTDDNTFSLQIKVNDVGGGTTYLPGSITYSATTPDLALDSDTELNRIEIVITAPSGWSGLDDCQGDSVELVKGSVTLNCDVTVPVPSTVDSSQIKVVATYGYWTEKTASVKVSGK